MTAGALKDTRFKSTDVDSTCGLHSIFVTASPVLTNEVRRYYEKLREKIKAELANKDKKREQSLPEVLGITEIDEAKERSNVVEEEKKVRGAAEEEKLHATTEESKIPEDSKGSLAAMFEELKGTEDELAVLDEGEVEKQLSLVHTLNLVPDDQFPLFLTLRRLLVMIDGTLRKPFFARNARDKVIGLEENAEWHSENNGIMMINSMYKVFGSERAEELETQDPETLIAALERQEERDEEDLYDEDDDEEQKAEQKGPRDKNLKKSFMAKEVNFEMFAHKFWPTLHGRVQFGQKGYGGKTNLINPASVWTEIQTRIKGSIEGHEYACHYIPDYVYTEKMKNSEMYDIYTIRTIYQILYRYENWCAEYNYYDMLDIVNHILSQIRWKQYTGPPIHFIMCDEVQDLPPAALFLLLKLTEQNIFFSGDTAQTISRGIHFRFGDLKALFNNVELPSGVPSILQLTVNFRSHGRILDLANSVIRILEIFFPSSIDKLSKEKSSIDGMIPIVLDSTMKESLFNLLSVSDDSSGRGAGGLLEKSPIEFGCDQVIIVRNQQAKEELPKFLKHALCLTVYEAKGLEFDDVILYNFFTDSESRDEWKFISSLVVEDLKVPRAANVPELMKTFEQLTIKAEELLESYKDLPEGEYEVVKNVRLGTTKSFESKFLALTSELKHLYTAITRPRKRLIIFDEDAAVRKPLLDYWLKLGYVNVITEETLEKGADSEQSSKLIETLAGKNTSKAGWRAQGVRMFTRKYYEQAVKCFEKSGDSDLKFRAEGYYEASRGAEILAEAESLKYEFAEKSTTKAERLQLDEKITELNKKAYDCFNKAADIFIDLNMGMKAGQCYFTVQEYEKAASCFKAAGFLGQAGEAYLKMGRHIEAGELYEKANIPSNAIVAYDKAKDWGRVLKCLYAFKDEFEEGNRAKLIKKYIQLELKAIYQEYESANNASSSDKQLPTIEERLAEQFTPENSIAEPERLENGSGNPAEETKQADNAEPGKTPDISEAVDTSKATNPFDELNGSKVSEAANPFEEVDASKMSEASNPFVDLGAEGKDQSEDFSLVEAEGSEESKRANVDVDHIAGLDPDDEWLKCETGSIIDSVVSGDISLSNRHSDYSILDNAHAFVMNASLVNTKRDIFVEDMVMSKVIQCVSYFSSEVRSYLESLRSKSVQLHTVRNPKENSMAEFIVDLDNIDVPFVNLILDILESFGLYKLCIVICNRYQINEKIGRYLVSIGHRYSNIKLVNEGYEKYALPDKETYLEMQANNSIIASKAIHSVFEMINPAYLKMKKYGEMIDERNSLGEYCYRSMTLLGYWRKLVYIMDCKNSLAITSTFFDFDNYKLVYLINFGSITKENAAAIQSLVKLHDFTWLPFKSPSNSLEARALILTLDSVIYELNKVYSFTYRFGQKTFAPASTCSKFPLQFPCNDALWKYLSLAGQPSTGLENALKSGVKTFLSVDCLTLDSFSAEFALWDFCVALIEMLFGVKKNEKLKQFFLYLPTETYNDLLKCVHNIMNLLRKGRTHRAYNENYYTVYLAVLSAFGIRQIEGRGCRSGYGRLFSMCRNSIYFFKAAELAMAKRKKKKESIEQKIDKSIRASIKSLTKNEYTQMMKQKLREAMEQEHSSTLFKTP